MEIPLTIVVVRITMPRGIMTFICIGDFLRFNPVAIVVYMHYNGYRTVALLITFLAVNDVTVQYHSVLYSYDS